MGKKKEISNQSVIDFDSQADRVILALGQNEARAIANNIFEALLRGEWILEPPGEAADLSSAHDIVKQLGRKLPYPETIKVAQLHQVSRSFVGFSAYYQQKGWVFVNAQANEYERHFYTAMLTASLGLHLSYSQTETLAQRSEQLVFDTFLPENEISTFFHKSISKFSPALALDISDFFRLPFPIILKRALALQVIEDEQYRNLMTIKPLRPKKAKPLFLPREGELEGILDSVFWSEN